MIIASTHRVRWPGRFAILVNLCALAVVAVMLLGPKNLAATAGALAQIAGLEPSAATATPTLDVDSRGTIGYRSREIAPGELVEFLRRQVAPAARTIVISADGNADVATIARIAQATRQAGIESVRLTIAPVGP